MTEEAGGDTLKKLCPTCGKRIAGGKRPGSLTAYLFGGSDCVCRPGAGAPGPGKYILESAASDDDDFCPQCGLRIVSDARAGSLTGFLFQSTRCKCPADEAFVDGKMSDRFWKLKQTGAGTVFSSGSEARKKSRASIDLMPGSIIGGAYEIIQFIGGGGMGEVYLARHQALDKKCALKVIPPDQVTEMGWQRFQLEARAVAKLDHINLVKVTDLGIHEGCLPFYAMDFVEGNNLEEILKNQGPVPLNIMLDIFMQVCEGIDFAHRQGILHRDLKPANVMVTQSRSGVRQAKVLDFGLAKLTKAGRASQSLTMAGDVFGSPFYMSPEQCIGDKIDNRSDIYSIGCTMFECLTGRPPFCDELASKVMSSHLESEPPSLESACDRQDLPASIEIVMAKLLRKNPVERYQTLAELKSDLEKVKCGEAVQPFYVSRSKKASAQIRTAEKSNERAFPVRILIAAACLISGTTIVALMVNFHLAGGNQHKAQIKAVLRPPEENITAFVGLKSVGTQEALDAFSNCGPISNGVVTNHGVKLRIFNFPKVRMGHLTWGKGSRLAQGQVIAPAQADTTLEINQGDGQFTLLYPWILKKIGPDDIFGMELNTAEIIYGADIDLQKSTLGALEAIRTWKHLHALRIGKCKLTAEIIQALNQLTAPLSTLSIGEETFDGADLAKIRLLREVQAVSLGDVHNTDIFLQEVSNSPSLNELLIGSCDLSKEGLAALEKCRFLVTLAFDHPKLGKAELSAISHLTQLHFLKLKGCQTCSTEDVMQLSKMKHLSTLSLDSNESTLNALQKALPQCHIEIPIEDISKRLTGF